MTAYAAGQSDEEGKEGNKISKRRRRTAEHDAGDCRTSKISTKRREINGIILASTKPSYCLQLGVESNQQRAVGETLQSIHRRKLRRLLKKLLLKRNWSEASGVLSVLLKGTASETSLSRNRYKYWATLEIMRHIKGDNFKNIQDVYGLWMKKLRPMKKQPTRFAVQLESILYCLRHGNTKDAQQGASDLMQERGFESNSFCNLIVGLTFYELWYSANPKEMQLRELGWYGSPMQSQMSEGRRYMSIENYEGHEAVEAQDRNFPLECDSNTSIGNEKDGMEVNTEQSREDSMEVDYKEEQKPPGPAFQAQEFYIESAENSRDEGSPSPNRKLQNNNLQNKNYINAIKFLRVALYSEPPMMEAFHPLIQMLLLGDEVKEALDVIEHFSQNPASANHSRLKTNLLEQFDPDNYTQLSIDFENILKKDPTCRNSLAKLHNMHQRGEYSTEKLMEMVALHLDATFADCNTWKELASCLLKLSQCEEDKMSTCYDRNDWKQQHLAHTNRIPAIFTDPESQHTWRLRCRWWLTRHFSLKTLQLNIASGEVQLATYKAAAATHLYGREVKYVSETTKYLENEKNSDMLFILRTHIQNSVGFYFNLNKKNS